MKRSIIFIAAILMAITASGQVKGVDLENAAIAINDDDINNHFEKWVYMPTNSAYIFYIENEYPVDYKHLITELDGILKANDLDINKPDIEDDLLPSGVNGLRDYDNLSYYVALGKAEIKRRYYIDDEWVIGIICNYRTRTLFLGKVQEQIEKELQEQAARLNNAGRDAFGNQGVGETEGGEGITEGDGNQGVTTGSPDADDYGTGGGLGNGISFGGLGSRTAVGRLPYPMWQDVR